MSPQFLQMRPPAMPQCDLAHTQEEEEQEGEEEEEEGYTG
jgi:hypothetical protein